MQANQNSPDNPTQSENCPHIGLTSDPATFSGFPTLMNACHYVDPTSIPNLFHQRSVCLSPDYVDCPILKNGPGTRMPKALQYQSRGLSNQTKQLIMFLGLGAFTLALVFGLLFFSQRLPTSSITNAPAETQTGQTFIETTVQPTPEKVEFTRTQVIPTPTAPLPTATQAAASPTFKPQILALDTPIGDAVQFIIHSVVEGETLQLFADEYNTTVDAKKAVN